jgi:uncharacterized alpha-E superfamily protein
MLLSRVAENVYWAARYLERVEATARLVEVHTKLFLDLPRAAGIGWAPLLLVTGAADDVGVPTEEAVVRLLTVDASHAGSVRSCLAAARTNLRITRSVLPESAWEELNALHLWVEENAPHAVDRRTRLSWTNTVVRRCQMLTGLLAGVMSHDEVWSFLEIGRHVERADMTSRVIDVQAGVILSDAGARLEQYADVIWASVLRSLSAHQMFLRTTRAGVSGPEALAFLLRNPQFPRSVEHCLLQVAHSLLELPFYDAPMAACAAVQAQLVDAAVDGLGAAELHRFVDRVQLGIGVLHDAVSATYFTLAPAGSTTLAPA